MPSHSQLEHLNQELSSTVEELTRTAGRLAVSESRGREINRDLERRVSEKTAELRRANAQLTDALVERTSALRALASNEEAFRTSFEFAAVGKAQVDPDTAGIRRANAAFAHMLGYTPGELVGRKVWALISPEDVPDGQAEYARLLAGEIDRYANEKRFIRRDRSLVWARISATAVRSPETGKPAMVVAVVEDIDERHKAQVALQAAKQDLETVVEERTAALRQRDILLREVYHRVKNNLQIVDSLLIMQSRQLSDKNAKIALLDLRRRVFALGLVHHQLMDSKNLQTFDIAPFLTELSTNIVEGGPEQNINLSVKAIPLDVGLDFAIPLGLLVTELVTNALKHAFPRGIGNISVILERRDDAQVSLIVSDDGQGPTEAKKSSDGSKSGIGAGIIAGLVAQLKGTMTMRSDKGMHTEIRVAAPVLQ